jgi:hypothetical protein
MEYYVYRHLLSTGEVFYVGKGKGKRAKSKQGRNIYWRRLVDKYGYTVEIVAKNITEDEAFELEILMISEYKSLNLCKANLSLGGDGPSGVTRSLETRKKMSEYRKGRSRGPFSIEHRRRISEATKKQTYSSETRLKMAEAKKKKVICTETGVSYPSVRDAAKATGHSYSYMKKMLSGHAKNTTSLKHEV